MRRRYFYRQVLDVRVQQMTKAVSNVAQIRHLLRSSDLSSFLLQESTGVTKLRLHSLIDNGMACAAAAIDRAYIASTHTSAHKKGRSINARKHVANDDDKEVATLL